MMETIENYFENSVEEHIESIVVYNRTYQIRRLDGLNFLQLQDIQGTEAKFTYILANCLINPKTNQPLGNEIAIRFLKYRLPDGIEIINKILDLSELLREMEQKEYEKERQNFNETHTSF